MGCQFITCVANREGICRADLIVGSITEKPIHPSCPEAYKQTAEGVVFDSNVDPFAGRIFGGIPTKPFDPSAGGSGDHGGV